MKGTEYIWLKYKRNNRLDTKKVGRHSYRDVYSVISAPSKPERSS